jgi:hypothetical protein
MKYYKDTNNKPFAFEDNASAEIIAGVEATHNTSLTEITLADYEALIAPTLAELQSKKQLEIKTAYEADNQADIAYMSTTFQADKDSQNLIVSVLSAGSVPSGFYWLDSLNNQVSMTYADLQGLSAAILARGQASFVKYQDLKAQVNSATTQDELDLILW